MGRKKKKGFTNMKMLASRIEESDFNQFEHIIKHRDGKTLQEVMNAFVRSYISGTLHVSGSGIVAGSNQP